MIEDMTVRNLSPATQQSPCTLNEVATVQPRSFRPARRSGSGLGGRPGVPGPAGVDRDLLAVLNQTVCALRFFYGETLAHGEIPSASRLCARAEQAAGGAERRRGGAVPGGSATSLSACQRLTPCLRSQVARVWPRWSHNCTSRSAQDLSRPDLTSKRRGQFFADPVSCDNSYFLHWVRVPSQIGQPTSSIETAG